MAEEKSEKKKEYIDHYPDPLPDGQEGVDYLITWIGSKWGDKTQRWGLTFPIPKNEEEAQSRYDCPMSTLAAAGVRQFSTRPGYLADGFDYKVEANGKVITESASLKPNGHALMQKAADEYKVGQTVAADSTRIKKTDLADLRARESAFSECTRLIFAGKLTRKTAEAWLSERGIDPSVNS